MRRNPHAPPSASAQNFFATMAARLEPQSRRAHGTPATPVRGAAAVRAMSGERPAPALAHVGKKNACGGSKADFFVGRTAAHQDLREGGASAQDVRLHL